MSDTKYGDLDLAEANPPLQSSQACLHCKEYKIRCDGLRPTCSLCETSGTHRIRSLQNGSVSNPMCTYRDLPAQVPQYPGQDVRFQQKTTTTGSGREVIKVEKKKTSKKKSGTCLKCGKSSMLKDQALMRRLDRLETRLAAIHARQNISLAKSNRSRQDDITPLRELPCLEVKAQNLWADSDATLGEGSLHRLSIDDPNNHNPDSWISAWARETMRTAPAQSCSPPLPPGPPVVSELPPM